MTPPKSPAAYKLTDPVTGGFYVGSTRNLHRRLRQHQSLATGGRHYNALFDGRSLNEFELEYSTHPDVESARKREASLLNFHSGDEDMANVATSVYAPWAAGNIPESHREVMHNALVKARVACKSPEALKKLSDTLKGRQFTEETKERMSDSAKARGNNFSEEGIAKGRAKRSQPILVDGVSYESSRAAGRAHGVCEHTAKHRANSSKFDNWSFGPKEIQS